MAVSKQVLSEADHEKISTAIRAAEQHTAGELYVVVDHAVDDFEVVPIVWAVVIALLLAWLLHLLTPLSVTWILAAQGLAFVALALGLSHWAIRPHLVPGWLKAQAAHRTARNLFLAHGIHLTEARTGVLLFVSLAERRVEVVADSGIHRKVDAQTWDRVVAEVTRAAGTGNLADGIAAGVRIIGDVLAAHYPPASQDRNELPDRVIEL